jgi:hypothetical protein
MQRRKQLCSITGKNSRFNACGLQVAGTKGAAQLPPAQNGLATFGYPNAETPDTVAGFLQELIG